MTDNLLTISRPLGLVAILLCASLVPLQAGSISQESTNVQSQKPIVLAQTQPQKKAEEKSKTAKPAKKKSNPWSVQCGKDKKTGKDFCRMQQVLRYSKTGQRLISVIIQPQTIEPKLAILISLPHGLYLPAGTAFKIDEGEENRLVIETCDVQGCYASGGVDVKLVEAMKKGDKILIGFQASNKKPITIPISLTGFTAAFTKIIGGK